MKKLWILLMASAFIFWSSVSATIINIPDDYATIQQGIDASSDGDTVLVQPGTYVENINFNGHNIVLGSLFLTTEDTTHISSTVIDGNSSGSVVTFENWENSTCLIKGFTIRNGTGTIHLEGYRCGGGIFCYNASPTIENNIIEDNNSSYLGGGVYCEYSDAVIRHNIIIGNSADGFFGGGGGIACMEGNVSIENNIITENECRGDISEGGVAFGGGIHCSYSTSPILNNIISMNNAVGSTSEGGGICLDHCSNFLKGNIIFGNEISCPPNYVASGGGIACWISNSIIVNNVITGNSASHGGGLICETDLPTLINNIFWGNTATVAGNEFHHVEGNSVTYCDIQGGWEGEGNINTDPLFRDPENGDYRLMSTACGDPYDSPCIDMGDPFILDNLLDCDWGLGYERSDMGAYGGQAIPTDIREEHPPSLPIACDLLQNYPNPFNASTTLSYMLPQSGSVTISIYNLLGQRVATIFEGDQQAGQHTITWDATDFPSGIYFARLEVGEYSKSIKMVLLK